MTWVDTSILEEILTSCRLGSTNSISRYLYDPSALSKVSLLGFQLDFRKIMSGVQGCLLEVTVVKCKHLNHAGFESNQEHPFVCIEYGSSRYHSRTFRDGNQGYVFQDKFVLSLTEGSWDIAISVYSSNTFTDGFIGRGRVQLQRVISQGYDDTTWPIFSENGRTTGEVCLMLCCPTIMTSASCYSPMDELMSRMSVNRGIKRALSFENYVKNEEELGRDLMRRKLTTETEDSHHLQPAQVFDMAMDELMDRTNPTDLDEDTEMACGFDLPSHPYSTMWNTICF